MIARGRSISHTKNALAYAQQKPGARELDRHDVSGKSAREIAEDFQVYHELNSHCQKNTLALVMSPSIADGARLNDSAMKKLTRKFLTQLQLDKHQWIAFQHEDRKHKHVHIYVNRIDIHGKAYDDSFISNKASSSAERVAISAGLTLASNVGKQKLQQKQQRLSKERKMIKTISEQVIGADRPADEQQYVKAFNKRGKAHNLRAHAYYNQQDVFQGVQFFVRSTTAEEEKLTASQVDSTLGKMNLLQQIENCQIKDVRQTINQSEVISR